MSWSTLRLAGSLVVPVLACLTVNLCSAAEPSVDTSRGDAILQDNLRRVTAKVTEDCLANIETIDDWKAKRAEYHLQLRDMLGLNPWPERTPLNVQITGTTRKEGFVVENIAFESRPGLYVTGSLYRPEQQSEKLPAILYVCGHGRVKKDGVSYGNKATYQHHGSWFARNGYVCLIIDTIQLGEIEGIHHGTYRYGMWWWNNRGYTPAGVEAWNGIRAIDYLQSRDEVDPERIGVTGRSGGGAYSWWVAALDDRVKAAVPVAGITSMQNHIVDHCIEGHCDCMFMVNTYAWDFPLLAAMVAPRALLISNTDKDRIFPLDGVVDVYSKVRRIYELHGALKNVGLNIAEGPHKDTQELRVNAFHWMNRFLKEKDPLINMAADKLMQPEELKVFDKLPEDERVTTIHETFVPKATATLPTTQAALQKHADESLEFLNEKSFRNWPTEQEAGELDVRLVNSWEAQGKRVRLFEFNSEQPYRLPLIVVDTPGAKTVKNATLTVLDQTTWENEMGRLKQLVPALPFAAVLPKQATPELAAKGSTDGVQVFVAPRGVGPTEWTRDKRERTHIRRRFALLGRTVDAMQVYDTLQAVKAARVALGNESLRIRLQGDQQAAGWALLATLYEPAVKELELTNLSTDYRNGPFLLNVSRQLTIPDTVLIAASKVDRCVLIDEQDAPAEDWKKVANAAKALGWQSSLTEKALVLEP